MSVLQEYQKHIELIGKNKLKALFEYVEKQNITYSDVIYNKKNWEEFDKWYKTVYNNKYGKSSKGDKKI